ncbi:site-specific DNA-methyltransferase [Segatella sp.]|uniref:site-specific DNA-methyltransferase n=1 Tax=Segatella sp. TaxID=2974253 RepID=UPI003A954137
MTLYEQKFRDILAEILQLDQAELDFGIYRIMNQKRKDIEAFLNNRLVPEVTKILKTQTAAGTDISAMENEVFSHLAKFFSRYYEGGDFISKRRYKDDAYAIPYSGEEVKLYWANADQYYIKTSEYFKNYSFVLPTSRRKVHFVLRDADTEQNNNKAANNMERRFQLCEEDCIAEEDGELNIFFTYELMPKTTKQDALIKDAEAKIISSFAEGKYVDFAELVNEKVPTEKNKERTLLMKHLQDYTAKNNFDYFIHKDLGGFLRRELDFYIKNEVMFLDDLDATHIMEHLAQVKAIKQVGEKIITFLAQLEDFQKKLWLKKKFVVGCDYCITLDRIPRTLYSEIVANDAQRQEWVRLFAIDEIKGDMMTEGYSEPLTEKFLEDNPFLVLDTKFFSAEFKHKLVGSMEKVDEECNGLLINSENFQALELLQEKCSERVQNIYADPPYNTSASEIMYKNSYKHSSWLSLLEDRIRLGKKLLLDSGIQCTTIDDVEQSRLSLLLQDTFAELPETVTIRIKPSGRPIPNGFAISHEYALFSKKNLGTSIARLTHSEEQAARYREKDDKGRFLWELLRKAGSNSFRENRPTMYYPLFVNTNSLIVRLPKMRYEERTSEFVLEEQPLADEQIVFPIKDDGKEGRWYYGVERAVNEQHELKAVRNNRSSFDIYRRRRPNEGVQPTTSWIDSKYSATEHGTDLLKRLFGQQEKFSYPKSVYAVEDCLRVSGMQSKSIALDYFAGSGTTGHAVINLNREDKGNRKYILCEMAEYFNSVTKPRIEKVIYSEDWKDGKPVSRKGISQCFKYIRLEQYEDTLNNLQPKNQRLDFDNENGKGDFEETYFLRYMLDTETKGDLFNLEWFKNPFAMSIKTTKDNELVDTHVDMVETFNYLIGLNVETLRYPKDGYCVVEGTTHIGNERTLVIWRNCNKVSNEDLNEFFRKQAYCTTDSEFDKIYVNGDNTLPNIKTDEEHWKVVLIEEEFKKRMFE